MQSMIELHPKPDALHGLGLPAIPYPVALPAFQAAVANDGELPLADMLHGLQRRAAAPTADWRRLEPAMARLAELLASDDARESITTGGAGWWLELGPIDPGRNDILVLQRGPDLVAAIAPREDGRLRVAAYRPLDGHALETLLALAVLPAPPNDSADAPTCWERALHAAAASGPDAAPGAPLTRLLRCSPGQDSAAAGGPPVPGARKPACVLAEIETFHMLRRARRD